jgi:ElaB/YqjD/DUF883 family membrane-anchored ribosome-binding protein
MMDFDNRSPEEIEQDIERTRQDFSSTIDAIQHKLTPSEMMDRAVDYARTTTPGAFTVNLVNSVRENPIPVTLIGIGITWLMSAGRRQDRYMAYRQRMDPYYPEESLYERDYDPQYPTGSMNRGGEGMAHRVASKASETAQDFKHRASETAHSINQRMSDSASAAAERVHHATQSAKSGLEETAAQAQARMNALNRRSQEQIHRARERMDSVIEEQPLVLGALGLAVGAILGSMLQPTRRENELMGGVRDELMERAKETAMEQAETVKQSAQRVAETAREEAEKVKSNLAGGGGQGNGIGGTGLSTGPDTQQQGGMRDSRGLH